MNVLKVNIPGTLTSDKKLKVKAVAYYYLTSMDRDFLRGQAAPRNRLSLRQIANKQKLSMRHTFRS